MFGTIISIIGYILLALVALVVLFIVWGICEDRRERKRDNEMLDKFFRAPRPLPPAGAVPDPSQAVDLGLPSGTMWAPWNMGASQPSGVGALLAWGETVADKMDADGHPWFFWDNYRLYSCFTDDICTSKYLGHNKAIDPEDDAATVNWGQQWKMPTVEQFQELINPENCTWEWKQCEDGTAGYVINSVRNGNSLFLPAPSPTIRRSRRWANMRNGNSHFPPAYVAGNYWSSELCRPSKHYVDGPYVIAWSLYFDQDNRCVIPDKGCDGLFIRPVLVATE